MTQVNLFSGFLIEARATKLHEKMIGLDTKLCQLRLDQSKVYKLGLLNKFLKRPCAKRTFDQRLLLASVQNLDSK